MISLLINSWRRPNNIIEIVDKESQYSLVDEIIIFNNYKHFDIKHQSNKVRIINSSYDFGLRTRWVNLYLAKMTVLYFKMMI